MHIPTHILSGWVVASAVPRLTPRERGLAMLAASLPDLDGLGLLASREAYETYHHVLGHNIFAGLILTAVLTAFATDRRRCALLFLGLFHLHLVMDSFGSGMDWGIAYLWPVVRQEWMNPWRWGFFSWQNLTAAYALVAVTVVIAARAGRTPLEMLAPALDRQLVTLARRFVPAPRPATT